MSKQIPELRGHHIHHLKDYLTTKNHKDLFVYLPTSEEILKYGQEYCNNREKVLENISKENSLIKIIAKHDSFCNKCNFKVEEGCLMEGVFHKEKKTGMKDNEDIKYFGLELNKI